MALAKETLFQLRRFATAFKEARERGANESDTVMYLVKFFEEALGYDSLKGEISKELAIKDRFCDLALKVDGSVRVLVEVKAAKLEALNDKHIEQAENYASRLGLPWVVLTNGLEWRLYHLTFNEGEGIAHDLAFEANLVADVDADPEALWTKLGILSRAAVKRNELDSFWSHKKVLSAASVIKVLFHEDVLGVIRRELNREAPARLDLDDVFSAVRDVLSKEALADAGDLGIRRKRKRRRKIERTTESGQLVMDEVEEDAPDEVSATPPQPPVTEPQITQSPAKA